MFNYGDPGILLAIHDLRIAQLRREADAHRLAREAIRGRRRRTPEDRAGHVRG
ncbi:hypothetical protein [Actinoplanes sp. NPDC051494]|uniref:hypothetical protein n=1 Tax=Actinoplanes sp. NPDC051494 TaxID=3363907 RepID=UPI0037BD97F4